VRLDEAARDREPEAAPALPRGAGCDSAECHIEDLPQVLGRDAAAGVVDPQVRLAVTHVGDDHRAVGRRMADGVRLRTTRASSGSLPRTTGHAQFPSARTRTPLRAAATPSAATASDTTSCRGTAESLVETPIQDWIRTQDPAAIGKNLHQRFVDMHAEGALITPEHSARSLVAHLRSADTGRTWTISAPTGSA
jgi:hypothetical protein